MKRLLIILAWCAAALISFSQNKVNAIRFDGVYQMAPEIDTAHKDTTWNYLRFYEDGTVISIAVSGTLDDIATWFTQNPTREKTAWQQNPSKGQYKVKGGRVTFTTTSKQGSVVYKGKVTDVTKLELQYKSLITGDKGKEVYHFVKAALN